MESVRQAAQRTVEFGIYRDGDNNLDRSQSVTLKQAVRTSARDSRIEYTVEDTTSLRDARGGERGLRTDTFTVSDGGIGQARASSAHDMADPKNLARFVARVLDNAERSGAKRTWIELTDHGAGDGGGLEADSAHAIMRMPDMAAAIAQGMKMHAREHPEDADRHVDGVVANQCLMASLGFAEGYYTRPLKRPVATWGRAPGQSRAVDHSVIDSMNFLLDDSRKSFERLCSVFLLIILFRTYPFCVHPEVHVRVFVRQGPIVLLYRLNGSRRFRFVRNDVLHSVPRRRKEQL